MNNYRRIRISQAAYRADWLRDEMMKLQSALKRVGENWNDTVAQGVQTTYVNQIVATCNSINSVIVGLTSSLEVDLARIKELVR